MCFLNKSKSEKVGAYCSCNSAIKIRHDWVYENAKVFPNHVFLLPMFEPLGKVVRKKLILLNTLYSFLHHSVLLAFPYNNKKKTILHDLLNKHHFPTFQENNLEINKSKKFKMCLLYLQVYPCRRLWGGRRQEGLTFYRIH